MKITPVLIIVLLIQTSLLGLVVNFTTRVEAESTSIITGGESWTFSPYNLENFTIIVLPDTQYYSEKYPWIFDNQTQWIIKNKESLNIVFVTHLGDIVDHWWTWEEWDNANASMSKLDDNLPYGVLPGNHDGAEPGGDFYNYNNYFGYERYKNESWYGGAFQNINTNNYQLFSAGGDDYLIFHLQNNPSDPVLAWADNIIDYYPTRRVIVSTHYYIGWSWGGVPRSNVGNIIWEKLVKPHADQIFLVLCGHVEWEGVRTDLVDENAVIQMVSDYQDRSNGGNGYLRILTFSPMLDKVFVKTYSPNQNKFENDSNSEFTLDYDMTSTQANITILSNSAVSEFVFNHSQHQINFSVSGEENTMGYCNVTIPQALIEGEPWKYPIDENIHYFKSSKNATHRSIYFTYDHTGILPITITGTPIMPEVTEIPDFPDIPEFSSALILPLFVTFSLLAIIFSKRKLIAQRKIK